MLNTGKSKPNQKYDEEGNLINFFKPDFSLDDTEETTIYLMGETTNKALLDTGTSQTVCGGQ